MDGENDGVEVIGEGADAAATVVEAAVETPTSLCSMLFTLLWRSVCFPNNNVFLSFFLFFVYLSI